MDRSTGRYWPSKARGHVRDVTHDSPERGSNRPPSRPRVGGVNETVARQVVDDYVKELEGALSLWMLGDSLSYIGVHASLAQMVPVIVAIASDVDDGPTPEDFVQDEDGFSFQSILDASYQLQGWFVVRETLNRIRGPATAPATLSDFHRWAWEAARPQWLDGHLRGGVLSAAAEIEQRLQAKIGRSDVGGAALVREAFSLKPPEAGKARLRFPEVPELSQEFKSAHEGASAYGAGCFQVIRNSAAHRPRQLPEHVVVEHLASLSLFARMVESATVVTVSGPEGGLVDLPPFG